jgi:diguanylate cyclase (GGDEF)-like protein
MLAYWVVMAAAATTSFVQPAAGPLASAAAVAPALVAAGAVLLGIRRNRPRDAWPWYLLAAALVANAVGDGLFRDGLTFPGTAISYADVLYVLSMPCIFVAMITLGRTGSTLRDRSSAVDALTVTFALLLAGWTLLVHPLLSHLAGLDQAGLVVYPLADALLIAGVVRLYTYRRRCCAIMFLAAGAVLNFASDVAYSSAVANGSWHSGTVIDLGWLVFYAAWGAAGLHPSMARVNDSVALSEHDVTTRRLSILVATSLTGPAVLLVEALTGQVHDAVLLALGSAGIFVLNLLRVADALNSHRQWLRFTEHHDGLTGLFNRAWFRNRLTQVAARTRSGGPPVAVVLLNLDEFQVLNNTFGPPTGDAVLVLVAQRITGEVGRHHPVARLGGDEFAALIVGATEAAVEQLMQRLSGALAEPVQLGGRSVPVPVSMGVATLPSGAAAPSPDDLDLIGQAGIALNAAREEGRGRWLHFERDRHQPMADRMRLRSALDSAVAEEEFTVRYQPIVALTGGHTVGFEALVRWQHPTLGLLSPSQFIEQAEEMGVIDTIGDWVLRRAVAVAAGWYREEPERSLYVSVNVSARQLDGFAARVAEILDSAGLPAPKLMLELTESVYMRDDENVLAELSTLASMGVRLAIDDFGTGYSSLSYLLRAPFDVLKIDKSFVDAVTIEARRRALVDGIIYVADRLKLEVVAEGIESDADRALLAAMGCRFGQGYLFSGPLTRSGVAEWLRGARPPLQRMPDGSSLRA